MKISILLALLLITGLSAFAQQVKITGTIYDKLDANQRIPNVKIFSSSDPDNEVTSNSNGEYSIKVPAGGIDTIFYQHVGYDPSYSVISVSKKKKAIKKQTAIKINKYLTFHELETFVFSANKVDTVYGSTIHSVEDFIITDDESLLLLAYEKTLKKGAKIVLTDKHHKDITEATVPGNALYLYKDYAGTPYVVCENKVFAIAIAQEEIRFETVQPSDFYDFYNRVIDTIGTNFYYSTFNELYPAVSFIVTDKNDTTHNELIEIQDDFMMELYRAQYKYVSGRDKLWAYRKEQETGIDKEIWIGASSFTQDILYKPVYAPLFVIRDTVHVFDQYKKQLFKFDTDHQLVDSVALDFAQANTKEKWEQPLILDKQQEHVYGLYNKGGFYYIKSINCQDGKIIKELKLSNRFVERIKIFNGKVYYIYRPYESLQKKFIYSEDLKIPEE